MSKRSAYKKCKMLLEGDHCPICKSNDLATSWQGRINFLDVNKSIIAEKIDVKVNGEYAIKVR